MPGNEIQERGRRVKSETSVKAVHGPCRNTAGPSGPDPANEKETWKGLSIMIDETRPVLEPSQEPTTGGAATRMKTWLKLARAAVEEVLRESNRCPEQEDSLDNPATSQPRGSAKDREHSDADFTPSP